MNRSAMNHRLDYLDAVRAFALLLGIVFHASLSFVPVYIGWAVMDVSTSSFVAALTLVSHSFRMELFFLIAGFFSHMTFHKKGARTFINSRFIRIAIPFAAGWFVLRPLIVSGWVMGGQSLSGDVHVWNGLVAGFQSLSQLPKDLLVGSHLWFLYYLLLITAITLSVRALICTNSSVRSQISELTDSTMRWIADSRFSLLLLAIPTTGCLWFMKNWGMDTPDKSLIPHLPTLLVFGGFFSLGWILHRQKELLELFARLNASRIIICVGSILITLVLSKYQNDMGHPQHQWIRAGFSLSYALMMWSLVALSIGLFKRYFDRPNKVVRYLADASYWLYLVHLPIVVWLQVAFAELPLHWSVKLSSIFLITVGISLVCYDLFVRSTLIGKTLNGVKKERIFFRWGGKLT